MFQQKGGVVIKDKVTLDVAKKYHSAITAAGGPCNYKPSTNTKTKLKLEAVVKRSTEKRFECPACEYFEVLEDKKPAPEICPECGVVLSKYERVKSEKDEREKVRKQVLALHQSRTQIDDKENERLAEEKRRKQLEEEIQRELGIPKYLTTPSGLFSSGAFVLMMGIGVGVGGAVVYGNITEEDVITADNAATSVETQNIAENEFPMGQTSDRPVLDPILDDVNGGVSPSQQAMMQVAAAVEKLPIPSEMVANVNNLSGAPQRPISESMSNVGPTGGGAIAVNGNSWHGEVIASKYKTQTTSSVSSGGPLVSAGGSLSVVHLGGDPVWDLTLIGVARYYLKSGQLDESFSIASQISDQTQQLDLLGEITAAYVGEGKYDVVVERIDSLQNQQGQVPANYSRSLIYSKLAMAMLETGKPLVAQKLLVAAQDLAKVLSPREKAIATGFIAASQARSSTKEVATEKFRQANGLLNSISDSSDRLSGYVDLTPAYALSGDRIGALAILQKILQTSKRVLTGEDRVLILSKIVPILADIDSIQATLKVSKQIENRSVRDKTLFQLMSERLVANEIYEAMAVFGLRVIF